MKIGFKKLLLTIFSVASPLSAIGAEAGVAMPHVGANQAPTSRHSQFPQGCWPSGDGSEYICSSGGTLYGGAMGNASPPASEDENMDSSYTGQPMIEVKPIGMGASSGQDENRSPERNDEADFPNHDQPPESQPANPNSEPASNQGISPTPEIPESHGSSKTLIVPH